MLLVKFVDKITTQILFSVEPSENHIVCENVWFQKEGYVGWYDMIYLTAIG